MFSTRILTLLLLLCKLFAQKHDYSFLCAYCGKPLTNISNLVEIDGLSTKGSKLIEVIDEHRIYYNILEDKDVIYPVISFNSTNTNSLLISERDHFGPTFFPPYTYSNIYCSRCNTHLGWEYFSPELEEKPKIPDVQEEIDNYIEDENKLLENLKGKCLTFQQSYWGYEWCFHKEIKQYHLEDGIRKIEWSLGVYSEKIYPPYTIRKSYQRGMTPTSQVFFPKKVYLVESFIGGQHCDETKVGRQTEVWLIPGSSFKIHDIIETSMCIYRIIVIVPELMDSELYTSTYSKCQYCHHNHLIMKSSKTCPYVINKKEFEIDTSKYETKIKPKATRFFSFKKEKIIFERDEKIKWMEEKNIVV